MDCVERWPFWLQQLVLDHMRGDLRALCALYMSLRLWREGVRYVFKRVTFLVGAGCTHHSGAGYPLPLQFVRGSIHVCGRRTGISARTLIPVFAYDLHNKMLTDIEFDVWDYENSVLWYLFYESQCAGCLCSYMACTCKRTERMPLLCYNGAHKGGAGCSFRNRPYQGVMWQHDIITSYNEYKERFCSVEEKRYTMWVRYTCLSRPNPLKLGKIRLLPVIE